MTDVIQLNLARNALRYIVRAYNIREIFIPYYICPIVKTALRKENVKINFYHIDKNFMPTYNFSKEDYILYPNYFGICYKNVQNLAEKYKNLIVDNSHAFYSKPLGLASFNSLRKFFQKEYGIKNGSYLFIEKTLQDEFKCGEKYNIDVDLNYEKIVKNENILNKEPILYISKTTKNIIEKIDFEKEKEKRLKKFFHYHKLFSKNNQLDINLSKEDIPFVYPYLTQDENIAYELEKTGLIIYRYWQNLPKKFIEYNFYRYLIPIPLV